MTPEQIAALERFFQIGIIIALAVLAILLAPEAIEKIQGMFGL